MLIKRYLTLGLLCLAFLVNGQMAETADLEIDGLLIDNTKSKMGHDFYQTFYKKWIPPIGVKNYSIILKEKPSRGRGAQVFIYVNERIVDVQHIQPKAIVLEKTATASIGRVVGYLKNYKNIQKSLGSEDQAGSGIF